LDPKGVREDGEEIDLVEHPEDEEVPF